MSFNLNVCYECQWYSKSDGYCILPLDMSSEEFAEKCPQEENDNEEDEE